MPAPFEPFARHLARCNNVDLPGDLVTLSLAGEPIGLVAPAAAADPLLASCWVREGSGLAVAGPAGLAEAGRTLAAAGRIVWRDEPFDVRSDRDGRVVGRLDRGALPVFGIAAVGVHLNGLVERADGTWLWVARRAADKLLDPGKLDHLAAGGVPAGLGPVETMAKEAEEECGLPAALAAGAREVARLRYAMQRPEGLRRDTLVCYDLVLPEDWEPVAQDGEVAGFELWPIERAVEAVRAGEQFKFNVNLVLIDLFQRRGLVEPGP